MPLPPHSVIRFGEFSLSPDHYQLSYQGQPVAVGNKGMTILQVLIQAEGRVVSRDELVCEVWPGQIVTDAAINKQVARLREALAAYTDEPVLETVRGVGFRLIAAIEYSSGEQPVGTEVSSSTSARIGVAVLIGVVLIAGLLWLSLRDQSADTAEASAFDPPRRIALMVMPHDPSAASEFQAMLDILSRQIDLTEGVMSVRPHASAAPSVSTEAERRDALAQWALDGLLLINTQGPAHSLLQATWLHRDADGTLGEMTLSASDHSALILAALERMSDQMGLEASHQNDNPMPALRRAFEAARLRAEGHQAAAIEMLKARPDEAAEDCLARLLLMELWLDTDQADQALEASRTWRSEGVASRCQPGLDQRTVLAQIDQGNFEAASEGVSLLEAQAQAARDPLLMRAVWQLRAHGFEQTGDVTEGLAALEAQLSLSESVLQDWQDSARVHQLLGRYSLTLGHFLQASDHLSKAWSLYADHQDHEGMLTVLTVQIQQATEQAEFDAGLELAARMQPLLEQVRHPELRLNGLMIQARLHIETGQHTLARQQIQAMESLSNQSDGLLMSARTLQTRAYLAIARGDHDKALTDIESLNDLLRSGDPSLEPLVTITYLYEVYIHFKQSDLEAFESRFVEFQETWSRFEQDLEPFQYRLRGFWFALQNQYAEAERLFSVEIEASLLQGWNNWAIYTCYDLLDVQRRNGYVHFDRTLEQLASIRAVDYPYLKYAAEYQAFLGNPDQAFEMMTALRQTAGDFWTVDDQALLETYRERALNP